MSIFNHFSHLSLSTDQRTALTKLEAFLGSPSQVFMLKGYAGSGKTTILKGLIQYLKTEKKGYSVMAPTGRAAKVLRDKTGYGKTIHSSIYDFDNMIIINPKSEEYADHSFKYIFPIVSLSNNENVIIVDEASMISNSESKNELFTFGTDVLLQDLLTYAKLSTSKNKIIFVGDPAQLPPVTDDTSYALQASFFVDKGLTCASVEMTTVHRQNDNLILSNATKLRTLLNEPKRNSLNFDYDSVSFIKVNAEDIPSLYTDINPTPELGNSVIIAYSNTQTLSYNRAVRNKYFAGYKDIVPGDILLINNNNYRTYGVELFNGDMAKVISCSSAATQQSAPVYVDIGGKKTRKIITLSFRDVVIRIPHYDNEINCKIVDSLLNNSDRDLTIIEMKALYINFVMRFNEGQNKSRDSGQRSYAVGSEEFKKQLLSDPFVNALRVKYGYAITCHKSQGGEWNSIFIDYFGRVGLKDPQLKWCYTATTRAINKCYAASAPHFNPFSKLSIGEIIKISSLPSDALNLKNVPISPFHSADQHKCKSLKYWEIAEKLMVSPFSIITVTSLGGYKERFTLAFDEHEVIIESDHDLAGFFHPFKSTASTTEVDAILKIINTPVKQNYSIDYNPSAIFLDDLFSQIQAVCNDIDVTITNVKESIVQSYVTYFLTTSGRCSYIQFYFNKNNQLTKALPKSDVGSEDHKLSLLIAKLPEHAS